MNSRTPMCFLLFFGGQGGLGTSGDATPCPEGTGLGPLPGSSVGLVKSTRYPAHNPYTKPHDASA